MSDERGFLRAIQDNPEDDSLRLVYADWLEERGDPRSEYLRLVCALSSPECADQEVEKFHERLQELRACADPRWLAAVTTPWANLRYHRKTFALLGEKPVLSKVNVRKIERWESRCGASLPLSVREWYSLEGAEQRLASEDFSCIPLSGRRQPGIWFPVGYWDSGGRSGVRLDAGEDPPIWWNEAERESESFSAFAFQRVWSKLTCADALYSESDLWGAWEDYGPVDSTFPLLQAEEPAFDRRDVAHLTKCFSEGLQRIVNGRWREGIHPITRAPRGRSGWFQCCVSLARG
jgi:uncharacterized protein (TIGR02996 family)